MYPTPTVLHLNSIIQKLISSEYHRRLLIDTGEAKNAEYLKNLGDVLKRHNSTIEQVVLTHWHGDHIGGVSGVLDLVGHGLSCPFCYLTQSCYMFMFLFVILVILLRINIYSKYYLF